MPRTLLLVDDIDTNRMILKKMLDSEYDILEARDGREAVAVMEREHKTISAVLLDIGMPGMDGFEVLAYMRGSSTLSAIPVIVTTAQTEEVSEVKALTLGANDYITKPYNSTIIRQRIRNTINLRETAATVNALQRDKLTGLFNRETFMEKAAEMIAAQAPDYYVIACFDIDNFKVVNDQYGTDMGDAVLRHVAKCIGGWIVANGGLCCRVMADNFAVLYPAVLRDSDSIRQNHREATAPACIGRPISIRIGRYIVADKSLSVSAMYDRASLAELSVRGRYDCYIAEYDESMREYLLHEQQIVTDMHGALADGQFEPWFQPQYNHATGALVGAEALVRWRHPQKGLLTPPGDFIPVFERNGFIYEVDKSIWEQVCALLRKWLDAGRNPLPVSVNISRYDLFREDFYRIITGLVEKYALPVGLLRLEITESAFAKSAEHLIAEVKRLIDYGFTVEIDDFGSGYSSLNTLKDVPAQVLKLDMKFLETTGDSKRGGNILESVVRMAKWLGMSIIAEGVETVEQANFLKSIGCYYVQGYLYAKPMPVADYEALAKRTAKESEIMALETVEALDNNAFWDPKSMETLIFNSYVGGACILEYQNGRVELLRINDNYLRELGVSYRPGDPLSALNPENYLDERNLKIIYENLHAAIENGAESSCEVSFTQDDGGEDRSYIRCAVRVLAKTGDRFLFYCSVVNLTEQRRAEQRMHKTMEQMQAVMDHVGSGITATVSNGKDVSFLFANDKFYQLFGCTRAQYEVEVKSIFDRIRPEDHEQVLAATKELLRTEKTTTVEYRVLRRDKKETWVRMTSSIAHFEGQKDPVQLSILTDISIEKKAEQERRDTDNQLRLLMNDTPGGFCRMKVSSNKSTQTLYVNDGFCRLVDMTHDEVAALCGVDVLRAIHPDDVPEVRAAYREAEKEGKEFHARYRLRRGRQGYLSVMVFGRLQKAADGAVFMNAYFTDISQQTQSDERRRALLENLPCGAGIYEVSTDGQMRATYLNKRYRDYLGRKIGDLREAPIFEVVHPDDLDKLREALKTAISGKREGSCDIRIMDGRGGYIPFRAVGSIDSGFTDKTVIYVTYTPIPREELTLRETLPLILAAIMESSTDLSFAKDKDLRYICGSRAFALMAGLKHESELVGKTDYDLFMPAIANKYRSDDLRLMENGKSLIDMVEEIPSEDGVPRYSRTSKYLLRDTAGSIVGLYGTGRDITEYRTAFEQLNLLTNSIPGGLATYEVWADKMRLIYYSDGYFKHTGYSKAEYRKIAAENPLALVFKADLGNIRAAVSDAFAGSNSFNYEYRSRCKNGGFRWLNIQGVVVERRSDSFIANVVKFDITERKLSEEQLRMSEEQYRLAQMQSGTIMCRYDVADRSVNMSEEVAAIFGMPAKVVDVPYEPVRLGNIAPESENAYIDFYESIVRGERTGTAEFKSKTTSGWRWMKATFSTIFGDDGRPVYAVVSFVDTTELHRQAEEHEALLENERQLQRQAELDGMTGVYNRATTEAQIRRALARAGGKPCTMIIADLDNLKAINDTLGHPQGDRAIRLIAQMMKAQFRQTDIVGRIGGDEFIAFLDGIDNRDRLSGMMQEFLKKTALIKIGERNDYPIFLSIGIATGIIGEISFDDLYRKADKALYRAKRSGKKQFVFYTPESIN